MNDAHEKQAFLADVKPYLETLLEFARREIAYFENRGDLSHDELTPEEVVGETLLRAFRDRGKRPAELAFRAWLIGTEHRVLGRLLDRTQRERRLWAVSLDEPLPDPPPPEEDDVFWDWYQPDDTVEWEDLRSGGDPDPEEIVQAREQLSLELEPRLRRPWVLHDRYRLSVGEIAAALRVREQTVAGLIRAARARLRPFVTTEESVWNGDGLGHVPFRSRH